MLAAAIAVTMTCITTQTNAACDQSAATKAAAGVTSDFATLVGFTKATCAPSVDGDRCAIICISDLNIIGDNRNLALTMITASAATRMRQVGLAKFSKVTFADRELLLSRKYLSISANSASDIQKTLTSETEPPLQKAARVSAAYSIVSIPAAK
jgi:hypothetical protein